MYVLLIHGPYCVLHGCGVPSFNFKEMFSLLFMSVEIGGIEPTETRRLDLALCLLCSVRMKDFTRFGKKPVMFVVIVVVAVIVL